MASHNHKVRLLRDTCLAVMDERAKLAAQLRALQEGPYEALPCRGHWHVYCGGHEIAAGTLDEQGAREAAAAKNAEWHTWKGARVLVHHGFDGDVDLYRLGTVMFDDGEFLAVLTDGYEASHTIRRSEATVVLTPATLPHTSTENGE